MRSARVRSVIVTALVVALTTAASGMEPHAAGAAESCSASCARRMAACRQERCPAVEGAARAACLDTCRAATGCAAGGARIRTLASVVSECRSGPEGFTLRQRLEIRRGDCPPVVAMEAPSAGAHSDPFGACRLYGDGRGGEPSMIVGVFQRIGVSPDGRRVVFEVTDDFVDDHFMLGRPVVPREEGIFVVNADGSGLRRLGPQTRNPSFSVSSPSLRGVPPGAPDVNIDPGPPYFRFSPDGRTIVFSDIGPGADGSDAVQLVTLDLPTKRRRQITHFQASPGHVVLSGFFLDDHTIFIWAATDRVRYYVANREGG